MPAYGYAYTGRVLNYDTTRQGYYVESVALAPNSRWGPVPSCVPGLVKGDRVVMVSTGTSRDDMMIIAQVGADFPDIDSIPGLQAALDAKLDDTQLDAASGVAALDSSRKVAYVRLPTGTAANTVAAGDDTRMTDARTPTAHASTHATAGSDPVSAASIGAAADTAVVHLTGAETVAGVKTFSSSPVVPTATTSGQAANKGQVDAIAPGWTSYIPTWTMDNSDGTPTGAFKKIGSDLCVLRAAIVGGASVSLGVGDVTVSLPGSVPVASIGAMIAVGHGLLVNASGGTHDLRAVAFSGGNALVLKYVSSSGNTLTTPGIGGMTFVAGDSMVVDLMYPC
jgi:hypothetical protein